MRIRMLSTRSGSKNGWLVETFTAGETYDLGALPGAVDLGRVFVREGWAVDLDAIPPAPPAPPPARGNPAATGIAGDAVAAAVAAPSATRKKKE